MHSCVCDRVSRAGKREKGKTHRAGTARSTRRDAMYGVVLLAFEIRDEERDCGVRARGIEDASGRGVGRAREVALHANSRPSFAAVPVEHAAPSTFGQELRLRSPARAATLESERGRRGRRRPLLPVGSTHGCSQSRATQSLSIFGAAGALLARVVICEERRGA